MSRSRKSVRGISEAQLVDWVVTFLVADGYRPRLEVPNATQSVDIVATRNRWLTLVEAKVDNWRRAIRQCRAHESVADFVCIAVPRNGAAEDVTAAVADKGYGLIFCEPATGRCWWEVRPQLNRRAWAPERRRLTRHMRKITYAC